MSECARKDWLFRGCDFRPRYDERPRDANIKGKFFSAGEFREMITLKVYVRDVCTRCGKTIERPTKEPTNA